MIEWFVSSAILAVILITLRYVLRGKLSPKLQYGLWVLLLFRLLVPVSIGQSVMSVENIVPASERFVLYTAQRTAQPPAPADGAAAPQEHVASERRADPLPEAPVSSAIRWNTVFSAVWLFGAVAVLIWFFVCSILFCHRLRRCAQQLSVSRRGSPAVFISSAAASPCLFGLLRPAIYLTPEAASDEAARIHCLAHERIHYRHGDHIWSFLRCICLALHWFNPFVWWAAALSRTDAELACDEAAVRSLGETERAAYGRTLLRMTCRTRVSLLTAATTMLGHGGQLRTRIRTLAKPVKTAFPALLAAVLIAALAAGCTMTGGITQEAPASETEPPEALVSARIENAEPADAQIKALLEKTGASLLSDSEKTAYCTYLSKNFDALHTRGAFDVESRWTVERLSSTAACLTIYCSDEQDVPLDELICRAETGFVSDTRFRCFQASAGESAPEDVKAYTYSVLLSSVYQKIPYDCFADYLDSHYDALAPLGLWSYDTVWTISMTERKMQLEISGLPHGGSTSFILDLDTMFVSRSGADTQRTIFEQWFDFAVQWRLDKLPVFQFDQTAENNGLSDSASAYLTWLYAVNRQTLDKQGSIDPDWAYADVSRHFPIRRMSFDDLPGIWEFTGGVYPLRNADAGQKPLVRLDSLEADISDEQTIYTMKLTFLDADHTIDDKEWTALRAQVLSGDETGLLEAHVDTFEFRVSDGEPYFLSHREIMICR